MGRLLRERGQPVAAVASRNPEHAAAAATFIGGDAAPIPYSGLPALAGRLIIAVPDEAIGEVARTLAAAAAGPGIALHTSGTNGPEALAPLAARGFSCATLHPLQTVSSPEQGLSALPGVSFAISGEGPAADWAEEIAKLLDGHPLRIPPEFRAAYHAAAVMAGNYVIGLIHASVQLMTAAGIEERDALAALAPLIRASVDNALDCGPLNALTGPVERGDTETVASHLRVLARLPEPLETLYRAAGSYVLGIARRRGLPDPKAAQLERLLQEAGNRNV